MTLLLVIEAMDKGYWSSFHFFLIGYQHYGNHLVWIEYNEKQLHYFKIKKRTSNRSKYVAIGVWFFFFGGKITDFIIKGKWF